LNLIKDDGNKLFKEKKYEESDTKFLEGVRLYEK